MHTLKKSESLGTGLCLDNFGEIVSNMDIRNCMKSTLSIVRYSNAVWPLIIVLHVCTVQAREQNIIASIIILIIVPIMYM